MDMSRLFASPHAQEIGAGRVKNRSIKVMISPDIENNLQYDHLPFPLPA